MKAEKSPRTTFLFVAAAASASMHRRARCLSLLASVVALCLSPCAAIRIPHGAPTGRREFVMGTGALLSVPAAAHADRGKDLYKQDLEILNGRSGALADNFNLPQYDDEGRVVNANGIAEQTQFRELRRSKASVQVLNTWVQSAEGVWSDPVTGSTASAVKLSVLDSPAKSIADLGRPEQACQAPAVGIKLRSRMDGLLV